MKRVVNSAKKVNSKTSYNEAKETAKDILSDILQFIPQQIDDSPKYEDILDEDGEVMGYVRSYVAKFTAMLK